MYFIAFECMLVAVMVHWNYSLIASIIFSSYCTLWGYDELINPYHLSGLNPVMFVIIHWSLLEQYTCTMYYMLTCVYTTMELLYYGCLWDKCPRFQRYAKATFVSPESILIRVLLLYYDSIIIINVFCYRVLYWDILMLIYLAWRYHGYMLVCVSLVSVGIQRTIGVTPLITSIG